MISFPSSAEILESSAFLRDCAGGALDWHGWDVAVLEEAKAQDRPIFLALGYHCCDRCRAMLDEALGRPEVIAALQHDFVCVLVDRLQHAALDRVMQNAFELLNGRSGGWPLHLVLDPNDLIPFFAFTDWPAEARDGLPSLGDLLQRLSHLWRDGRSTIAQQNLQLKQALQAGPSRHGDSGYSLNPRPLDAALLTLQAHYDERHGGFGEAPKFPHMPALSFLLDQIERKQGPDQHYARQMAFGSLKAMGRSALRGTDGGFYRYCEGEDWSAPQGERTLADQAEHLALQAQRASLEPSIREEASALCSDIVAWCDQHLAGDDGALMAMCDANGRYDPLRLTRWNARWARALRRAGEAMDRPEWCQRADRLLEMLKQRAWRDDRLCGWWLGEIHGPGVLDDYAFVLDALLLRLQSDWRDADFHWAMALALTLMKSFRPEGRKGSFRLFADDHPALPDRPQPVFDDGLPSAGGVATLALLRLGRLTGRIEHLLIAERCLKTAWPQLERKPTTCCAFLQALEEYHFPAPRVLVQIPDQDRCAWRQRWQDCRPKRAVAYLVSSAHPLPAEFELTEREQAVAWLGQGDRWLPCHSTDPEHLAHRMLADGE